jgi:hypothetical protein
MRGTVNTDIDHEWPDSPGSSSGLGSMTRLVRGLAWRGAPMAEIEVDPVNDQLLVSCLRAMPDVEVDYSPALSIGFAWAGDDLLLTTLCLVGLSRWGAAEPTPEVRLAQALLGGSIGASVTARVTPPVTGEIGGDGGELARVALSTGEAAGLVRVWGSFAAR